MLGLKKKKEAEAAAAAAAAAAAPAADGSAASGAAASAPTLSLLGADSKKAGAVSTRKKVTPGELRIQKDITELNAGTTGRVSFPNPDDVTHMLLTVVPDSGHWRGGTFEFDIRIPTDYPHQPPKVTCKTKVYHPNIDLEGHVCLNILRDEWKPVLDINAVIYGILYLFYEPNGNDPLNHEAAALLRDNEAQFVRNVQTSLRGGMVGGVSFPRLIK